MNRGVIYALLGYGIWGFFPLYWKQLSFVPSEQQSGHRILWSFLLLLLFMLWGQRGREVLSALRQPRVLGVYVCSALLIAINWLTYLWAVKNNVIVEASLGYFINPLLNVVMGVFFLRERLRGWQWFAVGLATVGVVYLTWAYGSLPWVALIVAGAFGLYGLVRKMGPLGSMQGLTLEMGILFIPTLIFMVGVELKGQGAFLHSGLRADLFMIGAGVVTTVPLLFFTAAARRIPLSLLGIIQYITPTGQLLIGVLMYGEVFTRERSIGFTFVWVALGIFAIEGVLNQRKTKASTNEI